MPGVLYFAIDEADTALSFKRRLEGELNGHFDALFPHFEEAARSMRGRRATIVINLKCGHSSESVLYMIKSTATILATVANVIVVASNANAGMTFGDDRRQRFIWVDGMTEAEAIELATAIFPLVATSDLEDFFRLVNTLI